MPARRVNGSNGIAAGLIEAMRDLNTRREPSFEKRGMPADACTPEVTGSGGPVAVPLEESMAILHRFIAPPRSLEK